MIDDVADVVVGPLVCNCSFSLKSRGSEFHIIPKDPKGRVYFLSADSEDERDAWMHAILEQFKEKKTLTEEVVLSNHADSAKEVDDRLISHSVIEDKRDTKERRLEKRQRTRESKNRGGKQKTEKPRNFVLPLP